MDFFRLSLSTSSACQGSFATKRVNLDHFGKESRRRTRTRMSLMPSDLARLLDVRTASVVRKLAPGMTPPGDRALRP